MTTTAPKGWLYRVRRKYYWWHRQRAIAIREPGYFSQDGQDRFVADNVFAGRKGGCFVEVGANDGVTFSNTVFLERERQWTGLAIEPLPEIYAKLAANRKCHSVQGCIADFDGQTQLTALTGFGEMLSGITANYAPEHLQRIEADLTAKGGKKQTLAVVCYRLATLLQRYSLRTVDYLSIDCEGGEMAVLKGIDFGAVKFHCISIENNYSDPAQFFFLKTRGFRLLAQAGADDIYVHRDFETTCRK